MEDLVYTVRVSPRARRVALRVMPHGTVEVVLPRGVNPALVPEFLARNRDWIASTRGRLRAASRVAPELNGPRPGTVVFPAIDEVWGVEYDARLVRTRVRQGEMMVSFPDSTRDQAHEALRHWLLQRAAARLEPWVRQLAHQYGFVINRVSVRAQRSRWGSCSAKGNISLNARLLFLAPEVVRYLLLHELCHTVHLNHSVDYWALVERVEPRWKQLDRGLGDGFRDVPLWAYPE